MSSVIRALKYLLGWPGLVVGVAIAMATALYLDARSFKAVTNSALIEQLLEGYTLKSEGFSFYYASDGRVVGEVSGTYDVGEWEALDNVYCEQWQVWGEGVRRSWTISTAEDRVRRKGFGYPFNENDLPVNEFSRVKGNQIYSQ
ncbi:MAG: hypothetical protein AAF420_14605 [Pseudomonadota bacterium]